jgi:hypothetical protein
MYLRIILSIGYPEMYEIRKYVVMRGDEFKYRYLDPRLNPTNDSENWWKAVLNGQKNDFSDLKLQRQKKLTNTLVGLGNLCPYSAQLARTQETIQSSQLSQ